MSEHAGGIEIAEEDIGTDPVDVVRRWRQEIELAEKPAKKWHTAGDEVLKRYRDDEGDKHSRFNVLWANTETLKPAVYSQPPTPDVRRRITDPSNSDPVGREAATVLERGLNFAIDDYDFDGLMHRCVEDYLLPGRGVARVRYVPTMVKGEPPQIPLEVYDEYDEFGDVTGQSYQHQGETVLPGLVQHGEDALPYMLGEAEDEVVYESAVCEYVFWKDYLESPARVWEEVRWVAFRSRLSRKELRDQFPNLADEVNLDWAPEEYRDRDDVPEFFKKATVWEIWDKESRRVIAIAKGYDEAPLGEWDDPLELDGFFPNPRPLDFVTTTNSRVPIPVYKIYQDQAAELDEVTQRISKLTSMLKVRGVFDKTMAALENLLSKPDGTLIGVDNWAEISEKGGLDRVVSFLPIEQIAKVLQSLYHQRNQVKQTIHEITGLSDIIRGSTDPRETKGAQVLKAEFGSMRLQGPQRKVQRFIRDLLRMKAEIMAEHFGADTLRQISGVELPTEEEKAQAQQPPQPGQQPDPNAAKMLAKPTWDELMALLRDDGARGFRIDIETDSTIEVDAGKAKAESVEMIQAITGFLKESGAVAQQAPQMAPFMMQLLKLGLRAFKPGRLVEESMDHALLQIEQQAQQPQQDPAAEQQKAEQQAQQQEAQAKMQADQAKLQLDQQEMQMKGQSDQAKVQVEQQKLQLSQQEAAADSNMDERKLSLDEKKLVFAQQQHTDEMALRAAEIEAKEGVDLSKINATRQAEREKLLADVGPGIAEAWTDLQEGSRGTQEALVAASQDNTQMVAAAMQTLAAATEALTGAVMAIGGPKRILRDKKGMPVGIEPGLPDGQTLQ